jgi:hypothetical protein
MATTSPLRQRMIEDMTIRNLSQATQQSYLHLRGQKVQPAFWSIARSSLMTAYAAGFRIGEVFCARNGTPACDESGGSFDRIVNLPADIYANHSSGRSSAGGDSGAALSTGSHRACARLTSARLRNVREARPSQSTGSAASGGPKGSAASGG